MAIDYRQGNVPRITHIPWSVMLQNQGVVGYITPRMRLENKKMAIQEETSCKSSVITAARCFDKSFHNKETK